MERPTLVTLGWKCHDIVDFKKNWCVVCAKSRWYEVYLGNAVCLACCDIVPETEINKPLVLERFDGR